MERFSIAYPRVPSFLRNHFFSSPKEDEIVSCSRVTPLLFSYDPRCATRGHIRAKGTDKLEIRCGCCADHLCTLPFRQLDRELTNPTCCSLNQHALTGGHIAVFKKRPPGRRHADWDLSRFD